MKVKKEMTVSPAELEEGDEYGVYGNLLYLSQITSRVQHNAVFVDDCGYLNTVLFDDCDSVDIIREVEKPDSVTVRTLYHSEIKISDQEEGRFLLETDEFDYSVDALKMIDAIKAVKGMD